MTLDECLKETAQKLKITEYSSHDDKLACFILATRGGVVEYPIIDKSQFSEITKVEVEE